MSASGAREISLAADLRRQRRSSAPRTVFGDIVQFFEFFGVVAMSIAVAYIYHTFGLQTDFDFQNYAAAGIIGATGLTALLRRDGYYEFDRILALSGMLRAVASRWALVILGLLAFAFALKVSDNFSRAWLFAWSAAVMAYLVTARWLAARIMRRMIRDGGAFARQIAIVGSSATARQFAESVGSAENGLSVFGVFDAEARASKDSEIETPMEDLQSLERAAREGLIDDIVIASLDADQEAMARLVRRLSVLPVSVSICPHIHWLNHRGGAVTKLGGTNVLSLYRRPLEGWGGVMKRVEDYAVSVILLLALSPVLLAIAIAIKLQDNGPVLFAQKRHGFNNSVFRIYKFRTMTVADDGDKIVQATPNDPRVTPIGKILRRYSLDELPQLVNVIAGHMSLVGPRPHALAHNHQYAQLIENYSGRHKVKPGITGWAQVNGLRGETSENELMEERVRYDLAYIDNWSLWFDLKILAMTALAVAFPRNAV